MSKDELLKTAIAAAKAGKRSQAAGLFMQVVKIDPASEQGWLGLGYCLPEAERRAYCFRRVLAINPNNRIAKSELARLSKPESPPAPASPKQSPFVETGDFSAAAAPLTPSRPSARPAPKPDETFLGWEPMPPAVKAAQTKQDGSKKKKSNLAAAFLMIAVLVVCVGVFAVGYGLLGWPSPFAAAKPTAVSGPSSFKTRVPLATSSPTPDIPTPVPSPGPTIVYEPVYESAPCPFSAPNASVFCGYLTVPEDRRGDPSRTIKLAVAVYRSKSQNPAEPLVFLQGGPGAGAVELSGYAYSILVAPFLANRDFIVFDQRGTGFSEPAMNCAELTRMYSQDIRGLIDSSTRKLVYANAFNDCNALMRAQGIQLNAYTTVESAADVRDLLSALGYSKANLYGASYGTRLAQVIMREHPEIVNTAILDSVVPVNTSVFSNYFASIESGLNTLFTACALDPQCNAAYPNLETTFWELVDELDANPVTVTSANYPTGLITQTVTGETMINLVLGSIKNSRFIGTAPQTISRFKSGDFSTLVMQQASLLFILDGISPGLFINMMCREQVFSATFEEANTESNRRIIRDYSWQPFYGNVEDVLRTCKNWGASHPAHGENDPVLSDIPTLIITGSYDPTTPPAYGRVVEPFLSNSHYFEFPNLGHVPSTADSSGCAMRIINQFLDNPSAEPDRACMRSLKAPVFVVPYTGQPALDLKSVTAYGLKMKVPKDWHSAGGGFYYRGNSPFDITEVGILWIPGSISNIEDYFSLKAYGYRGLDGPLLPAGERKTKDFNWQLYTSSSYGRPVDFAMAETRGWTLVVVQFCNKDEHDALYQTVFLPMIDSVTP